MPGMAASYPGRGRQTTRQSRRASCREKDNVTPLRAAVHVLRNGAGLVSGVLEQALASLPLEHRPDHARSEDLGAH
jgi:hypothetical protein